MISRGKWFLVPALPLVAFGLLFGRRVSVDTRGSHATLELAAMVPPSLFRLEPRQGFPPYDAVYGSATHNSYWVDRDGRGESYASGTQERILDQLLHDHVRAIELDVHFSAGDPEVWSVYHTDKESNSLCSPLSECLKQLQLFQYLSPEHEVVNVVLELKELWTHVFWPDHTIAGFDRLLRETLGEALYTPREFLDRCAPGESLRACARTHGWPTLDRLRGKFIVTVLGNWNYNANDWVDYATRDGGVRNRAAFPMRSILDADGGGAGGAFGAGEHAPFDPAALAAAREASIFWQVEDLHFPGIAEFIAEHGVVRGKSSQSYSAQLDRISRGFQLIQNDHPWHFVRDEYFAPRGVTLPTDPSRRLADASAISGRAAGWPDESLVEPGHRLYVTGEEETLHSATVSARLPVERWETAPSTTRASSSGGIDLQRMRMSDAYAPRARARGIGCLRAASPDGGAYFMVCRQVVSGEFARVSVRFRHPGDAAQTVRSFDSEARRAGRVGDLIALRVTTAHGRSCVQASSASAMQLGAPAWNQIGSECFDGALSQQGVAATRDVLFVGTRRNGQFVRGADLVERSHEGGALVDLSSPYDLPSARLTSY